MIWLRNLRAKLVRALKAFRSPEVAITVSTNEPAPIGPGQSVFLVERQVGSSTFALYKGPSGSEARKWYEHVANHNEPGTMTFSQNGVIRSTYTHPTE